MSDAASDAYKEEKEEKLFNEIVSLQEKWDRSPLLNVSSIPVLDLAVMSFTENYRRNIFSLSRRRTTNLVRETMTAS